MVLLFENKAHDIPSVGILERDIKIYSVEQWRLELVHTTKGGVYFRTPGPPTTTSMVAARAYLQARRRGATVKKLKERIFNLVGNRKEDR
jgi:hypothetical protein